jgi:hypothetical protein
MKIQNSEESPILLLDVIAALKRLKIPYAIVGAMAVSFYGFVRSSLDADAVISIQFKDDKFSKLQDSLKKKGFQLDIRYGDLDDPIACVIDISDKFKNRVDLLIGLKGMKPSVFQRAKTASFMKVSIKIVSLEDLIAMKIFAGGPKDIQDVVGVLQVSEKYIKKPLLKRIVLQYGKAEYKKLKQLIPGF